MASQIILDVSGVGEYIAMAMKESLKPLGSGPCSHGITDTVSKTVYDRVPPLLEERVAVLALEQVDKIASAVEARVFDTIEARIDAHVEEWSNELRRIQDARDTESRRHWALNKLLDKNAKLCTDIARLRTDLDDGRPRGVDGEALAPDEIDYELVEKLSDLELAQNEFQKEEIIAKYRESLRPSDRNAAFVVEVEYAMSMDGYRAILKDSESKDVWVQSPASYLEPATTTKALALASLIAVVESRLRKAQESGIYR